MHKKQLGLLTSLRGGVSILAIAGVLHLGQGPLGAGARAAEAWPAQVRASYKVLFNGIEIGDFHFQTSITPQGYAADANAQLSALMGAFTWKGSTKASGTVDADAPKPTGYAFDYKTNNKRGSVDMSFNGASVGNVLLEPPRKPNKEKRLVPITPEHLKQVLDPMSAVLALTHGNTANPCARKLSIFDGRQRFDLIFSYRRQLRITETRPSGQPGVAFVCSVRYQPIAGHKPEEAEANTAATSGNIEIALRPVPSANLLVPHHVSIPMIVGSVEIRSERIEIITSNQRQIALTN